jgi:ATP-binding cassette subfamily C (CFTR/MRP) protein 1
VSEVVFENVLKKALGSKTRILVTHSLQLLSKVDYIVTIADGRVNERGTYSELIMSGGPFSKFVTEFVTEPEDSPDENLVSDASSEKTSKRETIAFVPKLETPKPELQQSAGPTVMQDEERFRGGVGWRSVQRPEIAVSFTHAVFCVAYRDYLGTTHMGIVAPMFIVAVVLYQGSSIMNPYWRVCPERFSHLSSLVSIGSCCGSGMAWAYQEVHM